MKQRFWKTITLTVCLGVNFMLHFPVLKPKVIYIHVLRTWSINGNVFQNGCADTANLHQVAVTCSNSPREPRTLDHPLVHTLEQEIRLMQLPYVAFQFSNLVRQLSRRM